MEITSYFQVSVALRTAATIFAAVNSGPEGTLSRSSRALIPILIEVPPTSMTKIFILRRVSTSQVGLSSSSAQNFLSCSVWPLNQIA